VLRELAERIRPGDRTAVEDKLRDLRLALAGEDVELVKAAISDLSAALQTLTANLYAPPEEPPAEPASTAGESDSAAAGPGVGDTEPPTKSEGDHER